MKKYVKALVGVVLLLVLDQLTKFYAITHLKEHGPISLIKDVFEFHYLENRGIAFGLFQNKYMLFVALTVIILIVIGYFYIRIPDTKRYTPLRITLVLLTAGAIGNMIDRVYHNFVVDFLYFKLINFPIFNVADCYVTIAMGLLVILILFYYKEEELNFKA